VLAAFDKGCVYWLEMILKVDFFVGFEDFGDLFWWLFFLVVFLVFVGVLVEWYLKPRELEQ